MGLIVFVVVMGLLDAHIRGQKSVVSRLENEYKRRATAWRKAHPNAVKSARWAGIAGAIIHGTRPAIRAYSKDWAEHYKAGRDRARAKYGRVEPQKPAATREPERKPAPPEWKPQPTPRTRPRPPAPSTEPISAEPSAVAAEPETVHPPLRLVHSAPSTQEGIPSMTTATAEITGIGTLRTALENKVAVLTAEADDAAQATARAQENLADATRIAESAHGVLDRHPGLVATIGGIVEPAQSALESKQAAQAAADHELAQAQAALQQLEQHRATEEAVQANANASSNTSVYQDA